MAHFWDAGFWSPEAVMGLRQHEPIPTSSMFLWAVPFVFPLALMVVLPMWPRPLFIVWWGVFCGCLALIWVITTYVARNIMHDGDRVPEEKRQGLANMDLLKAYWRRNVCEHYVSLWRRDGVIQAAFHDDFPWSGRVRHIVNGTVITIPLGGWFTPRDGRIEWRGKTGTDFLLNQRYRVRRATCDAFFHSVFAITLEDERGTRLPLTVKYALDLLDAWHGGPLRMDARFDEMLVTAMLLAGRLKGELEAAESDREYWRLIALEAARRIAATKRFSHSKGGAEIRAWLDEKLLEMLAADDSRRREVEARVAAAKKPVAPVAGA